MKINEKLLSFSVLHIEQKMEFQKCNCFFVDFLSFGRINVISTVIERKYTPEYSEYTKRKKQVS